MDIQRTPEGEVLILSLSGEFDKIETDAFSTAITEAIEGGIVRLLLDFGGLRFLDSSAVQCILQTEERLTSLGGALAVACPQPTVAKVFRLLEFSRRVQVCDDLDEARELLK